MSQEDKNRKITGKIVLRGEIECLSPVHVGSGKDENSDLDIMRDSERNPFIPATAFVGVLRHYFKKNFLNKENEEENTNFKNFCGYTEDEEGRQSALCCSNLTLVNKENAKIVVRDGVRIDPQKGLAEKNGKYDFEVLERGARLKLEMEFTTTADDANYVKKTVKTIYQLLAKGYIAIGAKTTSGLGKIRLVKETTKMYLYEFDKTNHVNHWLLEEQEDKHEKQAEELCDESIALKKKGFQITAMLKLKNSLLIRSYNNDSQLSDAMHIKSNNDWLIPGTSLKGAIRARAERIFNTLGLGIKPKIFYELFGFVEHEITPEVRAIDRNNYKDKVGYFDKTKRKQGKLRIHETILKFEDFIAELQTRVKIDRFTGGAMEGALFDSMPLFDLYKGKLVKLELEINDYCDYEAGLMLLVLKDLWSGDLAVGGEKNIGRGVFQGVRAEIKLKDQSIMIEEDITILRDQDKQKLQGLVDALIKETPDGN